MATEILRPNAPGDDTELAIGGDVPAATNWESVDEVVADDSTTVVECSGNTNIYERDLYNIPNSGVGAGVINFITVHVRCFPGRPPDQASVKIAIKSNGTVTEEEKTLARENWEDFSKQWNDNPADSQAWEWTDINALQIGVALRSSDGKPSGRTYCTQVYVVVDFTPAVVTIPRHGFVNFQDPGIV